MQCKKKILMARYNVDKLLTEHTSDVTIGGGGNTEVNGDGTYFVDWATGYNYYGEMDDGNVWITVPYPVCVQLVNFGRKSINSGYFHGEYPIYGFVDRLVQAYCLDNLGGGVPFEQLDKGLAWIDSHVYFSPDCDILASPSIEAIRSYSGENLKYWIINASLAEQIKDFHNLEVYDYNAINEDVSVVLGFIKLYSTSEQMLSAVTPSMIRYS